MPSPSPEDRLVALAPPSMSVALEPAISALDSLMLLNTMEETSGLGD